MKSVNVLGHSEAQDEDICKLQGHHQAIASPVESYHTFESLEPKPKRSEARN